MDLLQGLGCKGTELKLLLMDFFKGWLPEHGPQAVFLFDNFEENLCPPDASVPEPADDKWPELEDPATARFLSDLIYAGKTRILITCRYPFQLPDQQHRALKLIQLGAKVVTLSDSSGYIYDEEGIDRGKLDFVKRLKNIRRAPIGEYVDKYSQAVFAERGSGLDHNPLWSLKADCAFPCATENEIGRRDAEHLMANGRGDRHQATVRTMWVGVDR